MYFQPGTNCSHSVEITSNSRYFRELKDCYLYVTTKSKSLIGEGGSGLTSKASVLYVEPENGPKKVA